MFPPFKKVNKTVLNPCSAFSQIETSSGISLAEVYIDATLMDGTLNSVCRIIVTQLFEIYGTTPIPPNNSDPLSLLPTMNANELSQTQTIHHATIQNSRFMIQTAISASAETQSQYVSSKLSLYSRHSTSPSFPCSCNPVRSSQKT